MGNSNWSAKNIEDLSDDSKFRIYSAAADIAMEESAKIMESQNRLCSFFCDGDTATIKTERHLDRGEDATDVSMWWRRLCATQEKIERNRLRALLVTRPEDI